MHWLFGGLSLMFLWFLLWLIWLADTGQQTNVFFQVAQAVPYGDKVGHFLLYGILALLLNVAFMARQIDWAGRRLDLGVWLVVGLATLEELTQLFFVERTFDVSDWAVGMLGIWFFGVWLLREVLGFPAWAVARTARS